MVGTDDLFDEDAFARKLTDQGIAPGPAAELARRTARGRRVETPAASACKTPAKAGTLVIASDEPSGDDIAYLHAIMCQVGLPRGPKAVEGKTVFERECGGAALRVTAGALWDGQRLVQQSLPYGANPRLILAWLNTQAVKTRSPTISVGDSAAEFLRMLGKESTGGKNGTITSFKKQVQALAACHMTLGFNASGRAYTYNGQPVKQFEAWVNNETQQRALWPGEITFSDDYFTTLLNHAVPQDVRAMYVLKGSALAMDIYAMLAERLHRISGRPLTLHWSALRDQFGQEYQGKDPDRDFKKAFLQALDKVMEVYPKAKVKTVRGGLLLSPSPPPIPHKT